MRGHEPEPAGADLEAGAQQLGQRALPGHARAEARIVVTAAAHLGEGGHHPGRAQGPVLLQPVPEQVLYLMRKPQQDVTRPFRAGVRRLGEDGLHLVIVHEGNQRRHQHADRHPRRTQASYRLQPPVRGAGARLQPAREVGIQRGHGHIDPHEPQPGQFGQQVEVAQDQGVLGDEGDRMAGLPHHFQQAAREPVLALDGLVGVGIGTDIDAADLVARGGKFTVQQLDRVMLGEQPGLEVQPGREVQVGMAGAGIAVDAAFFNMNLISSYVRISLSESGGCRR